MLWGFRIAILLSLAIATSATAQTTAPSTTPSTEPATKPALTHEQQVDQLIGYLNDQYAKLLKSPDWIERSLAAISLARIPGLRATDQLLGVCRADPVPVVKIVAWQAILARAKWLDLNQFQTWLDVTSAMAKKDYFRGSTRVGLLRTMAIAPPTRNAKLAFVGMFGQTSALEPRDMPVIDALGDCFASWQTPDLAEYLFNRLANLNDAYRAHVTDLPTTTIVLERNGHRKGVVDYGGPSVGMPQEVRELQAEIDRVAGTSRWVLRDGQPVRRPIER